MMFTLGFTVMADETEAEQVTISALNVIEGGQGVGYYDVNGSGTLDMQYCLSETGSSIKDVIYLRPYGEWAKYDVSNLSGTYKAEVYYLTRTVEGKTDHRSILGVYVDDAFACQGALLYNTTGLSDVPTAYDLGNIYFSPASKTLTLKQSDYSQLIAVQKIVLTKQSELDTTGGTMKFYGNGAAVVETYATEATGKTAGTVYFQDSNDNRFDVVTSNTKIEQHKKGQNASYPDKTDWAEYDVSAVRAGRYSLKINVALGNTAATTAYTASLGTRKAQATNVALENVEVKAAANVDNLDASAYKYNVPGENDLGIIYISDTDELLRLENVGEQAAYLYSFTLTPVPAVSYSVGIEEEKTDIYEIGNNDKIYANVNAYVEEACNAVVITAIYNGSELESILTYDTITVEEGGTFIERGYQLTGVKGKTVKTMIWKADTIMPLAACGSIS